MAAAPTVHDESDIYCIISGIFPLRGPRTIPNLLLPSHKCEHCGAIHWHSDGEFDQAQDKCSTRPLVQEILDGLCYSVDDVAASRDLALILPYLTGPRGVEVASSNPNVSSLSNESTITVIYNIIPDDFPGIYYSTETNQGFDVQPRGGSKLVSLCAYRILVGRCPTIKPHTLYTIFTFAPTDRGLLPFDYGNIKGIHEHHVRWLKLLQTDGPLQEGVGEARYRNPWWDLLNEPRKSREEVLENAWMGRGNLWVAIRPDRFPIAETLAAGRLQTIDSQVRYTDSQAVQDIETLSLTSLPFDIYHLLCTKYLMPRSIANLITLNRHIRTLLLPHVNTWIFQFLAVHRPHYLPVINAPCLRGNEEMDWWVEQWEQGGIHVPSDQITESQIPWLLYARECSKSKSMRNRERIWMMSEMIELLARGAGLI